MELNKRDKAILVGLFLSKFDKEGLSILGFNRFTEAFNALGMSIEIKPASIKNYRDEFDPLFPNPRKGWNKRKIRVYCENYYKDFGGLGIEDFSLLIKKIISKNHTIDVLKTKVLNENKNEETYAKRLITGNAAENYFKNIYHTIPIFRELEIENTTQLGCGFDFKLTSSSTDYFYGIEVKGISANSGNILLTEKEYKVASFLKKNYFLFIVKNFIDKPNHVFYQNPVLQNLNFKKTKRKVTLISYLTQI